MIYERGLIKGIIWKKAYYDLLIIYYNRGNNWFVPKCLVSFPEIQEVEFNNVTNIDGKALNNIPEAVNKLALSARIDNSCETGWNKHESSYYSKQNLKFYHRVKV